MILAKTKYKNYNTELLSIIEIFKTWHNYLESYKYKIFIASNYNNLRQFMKTKNLKFK